MKEHKYRAWDTKWKRWILPLDISFVDGEWSFERRGEDGGDIIETAQLKDGIVLEQFTGLCDKQLIDGLQGDKVSFGESRPIFEIIWEVCNARFCLVSKDERKERIVINNLLVGEVIGTIHDEEQK